MTYDFRVAAKSAVQVLKKGVRDNQLEYLRTGMRDMSAFLAAYEGATPEEIEKIATGKIRTKNSSQPFEPIRIDSEPDGKGGFRFELSGRHRLAAARAAGAKHIVADVHEHTGKVHKEVVIPIPV